MCEDMLLVMSTPIKYHAPGDKLPKSHQLLLGFEDGSHMRMLSTKLISAVYIKN